MVFYLTLSLTCHVAYIDALYFSLQIGCPIEFDNITISNVVVEVRRFNNSNLFTYHLSMHSTAETTQLYIKNLSINAFIS